MRTDVSDREKDLPISEGETKRVKNGFPYGCALMSLVGIAFEMGFIYHCLEAYRVSISGVEDASGMAWGAMIFAVLLQAAAMTVFLVKGIISAIVERNRYAVINLLIEIVILIALMHTLCQGTVLTQIACGIIVGHLAFELFSLGRLIYRWRQAK